MAQSTGRTTHAATIGVERFAEGPNADAQLASLKGTDSWKQDKFIEDGGWPGTENPIDGAAALCTWQLIDATAPAKAPTTSG